ncbi:MAG: hypothetical protein WCI71_09420 [Bacteroidota bacterium]
MNPFIISQLQKGIDVLKGLKEKNPIALSFSGIQTKGDNDHRRDNMYLQFTIKNITNDYDVVKSRLHKGYIIRKKITSAIEKEIYQNPEKYIYIYPELFSEPTPETLNIINNLILIC